MRCTSILIIATVAVYHERRIWCVHIARLAGISTSSPVSTLLLKTLTMDMSMTMTMTASIRMTFPLDIILKTHERAHICTAMR